MVYYRQYRPQKIAELDSPKLRETLYSILKGAVESAGHARQADSFASAQSVPHAFLFTGPKGLGKTSTARIIAKVLNCTNPKRDGVEPCNECDQCRSITNGTNIDVLEIDGASNRGIDEIRELRERVNLAPSSAKMKVYIIDEVHMLTTEAFNALLKTIEEPPVHVVFIFATTEPHKVPATIISRCFHVSLNRATKEELVHALRRIVKEEKIDIDEEALACIAEMGDGGYRDATKILEELVAISGRKKIDKNFVEEKLFISGVQFAIFPFLTKLAERKSQEALQELSQQLEKGTDLKYFISQCLQAMHDMLLMQNGVLKESKYQVVPTMFESSELQILITLFSEAYQQTKYAVVVSLPLELAIVAWCRSDFRGKPTSESLHEFGKPTMKEIIKKEQNLKVKQVLSGTKLGVVKKPVFPETQTDMPKDIKDNSVLLDNVIFKVKQHNVSVAGVLRSCIVQSVSDTQVTFQTAYTFHKERLEDGKSRELLEQVLKEITGKNLKASVMLKAK